MSLNNQQIRALAERVAHSHGLDVVDLEFAGGGGKHRTLRIFLERDAAGRAVLEQRLAALRAGDPGAGTQAPAAQPDADAEETDDFDDLDDLDEDSGHAVDDEEDDELDTIPTRPGTPDGDEGAFDDDVFSDDEDDEDDADEEETAADEDPAESSVHPAESNNPDHGPAIELDLVDAGEAAGLSPEEDELAYLREVPAGIPVAQLSGITHGDCERFSRDFGTALDVEDLVPGAEYLLEASSPGLDRKLSRPEEFQRFQGMLCKVQLFTPISGNRHWQAHLGEANAHTVTLVLVQPKTGKRRKKPEPEAAKTITVDFSNIEKAQLVPEF